MKLFKSAPIIVSGGGMEHYGQALKAAITEEYPGMELEHIHVPTDRRFPDGEMDARCVPEGFYDTLHQREVLPVLASNQDRLLESLRLMNYIKHEIMGTVTELIINPYAASARADKDQGKFSGKREIPYHRGDFKLLSPYAPWLMAIDHHNASQAKGREIGLKNVKTPGWIGQVMAEQATGNGDVVHFSPDQSAHARVSEEAMEMIEVFGGTLNQMYAEKERNDVTSDTSIKDIKLGFSQKEKERTYLDPRYVKEVETVVMSDDIISSGGTMINAYCEAVRRKMLDGVKRVVFSAPNVLGASTDTPENFRGRTIDKLNAFANSPEMAGVELVVVGGSTLANPIDDFGAGQDFKFVNNQTARLIAKQLRLA